MGLAPEVPEDCIFHALVRDCCSHEPLRRPPFWQVLSQLDKLDGAEAPNSIRLEQLGALEPTVSAAIGLAGESADSTRAMCSAYLNSAIDDAGVNDASSATAQKAASSLPAPSPQETECV